MATDIVRETTRYERWLEEITDVQKRGMARKHHLMSKGPFPHLRATFYRWVEHWTKLCPELDSRDEDVLLAVGDLHVENFGTWLDSRARLVWGVNDFDEACEMPFTSDLARLATSITLAAEEKKLQTPLPELCKRLLDGYREGLATAGVPIFVESGAHPELGKLVAAVKEPTKFWHKKLNEKDNPRVRVNELPPRLEEMFRASFSRHAQPQYRRQREPGGLGSLGRRRYTAVLGQGASRDAREAKALLPSALYWWQGRSEMLSQTGTLLQRAIRCPDPCLQIHDKWLVRKLAPDVMKIELPNSPDVERLAFVPALFQLMGTEVANIHLGSRSPADLLQSLEKLERRPGSRWLEHATERMVKATRQDYQAWAEHHR